MKAIQTGIDGLLVLEPRVFGDSRGFFLESWNEREFCKVIGFNTHFVQDNHSRSSRAVLRGLHYQQKNPQGKLVRVVSGAVWDVAVDLRIDSQSFGQSFGCELSAENHRQLWIPPGFAHGFGTFNARFDALVALEGWVEKGQAPKGLTAMDANQGANRTRPLCEYPAWPKFTGAAGTENNAASYTCVRE